MYDIMKNVQRIFARLHGQNWQGQSIQLLYLPNSALRLALLSRFSRILVACQLLSPSLGSAVIVLWSERPKVEMNMGHRNTLIN